jgi:hypothetical protein
MIRRHLIRPGLNYAFYDGIDIGSMKLKLEYITSILPSHARDMVEPTSAWAQEVRS